MYERWDPEMLTAHAAFLDAASRMPPIALAEPFEPQRAVNDALAMTMASGGPAMAETRDVWIAARGRRVFCRLYRPTLADRLPVLVYFHGGGWVWSSVDTHDRLTREYAAASGCAVLSVDYALSPEARFPQALEECAGVIRWLAAHGASWGIDPDAIAVGGDSAGGNLALGVALLLRAQGPALRGILATYPVCDADFTTASYRIFGAGGFFLTEEKMRFYWSVYARDQADRLNPLASPLLADLRGLPPVLVHLAELDVLHDEGTKLVARLREAGVPTETEVFAGVIHGFIRATGRVEKARDAVAKAGAWLHRTLMATPPG